MPGLGQPFAVREKIREIKAFLDKVDAEDAVVDVEDEGESDASGDEEVVRGAAVLAAPAAAPAAAAAATAPAVAAPAVAAPAAALALTAQEEREKNPQTKTAYQRSLSKVGKQLTQANSECTRLKQANATLAHALRQSGTLIPEGALYVSGTHDEHQADATAGPGTGVPIVPLLTNRTLSPGDFPFGMRMLHLPDTTTIMSPKRFGIGSTRWPHLMDTFKAKKDFAPHTEKRAKQYLQFGLFDLRDGLRKVTEQNLRPDDGPTPLINFKLYLVYDDDLEEVVKLAGLNERKRAELVAIAEPNILGVLEAPLSSGKVLFKIRNLHVLSTQTEPAGRKFVYKLVCTHPTFKNKLFATSPAFYNVSKSKVPQLEARPGRADAPDAAQ